MISPTEMKVVDRNAEFRGMPSYKLMENAGRGLANFIKKNNKIKAKNIIVFCGIGNNAGDGFVAARYLKDEYNVTVFLTAEKKDLKTKNSKKNFEKLNLKIFDINSVDKIDNLLSKNDLIIDSMLGIGLSGSLRQPYKSIVKKINSCVNKKIISVDVPTGFGTDIYVKADYTVTFHDAKKGMNKKCCGEIIIVDIGIPEKAIDYVGPGEIVNYYPIPSAKSHKGQNGTLLIVGGGPYYGAPALSSFAAQRIGVDLVYLLTPKKVARAISSYSPLLIKPKRLAKDLARYSPNLIINDSNHESKIILKDIEIVKKLIEKTNALLIGPGLGNDKQTEKAVEKIISIFVEKDKPIVIDADAIKVIGKHPDLIKKSRTIITPHSGEFKELTSKKLTDDLLIRTKYVKKYAKDLGSTILLKGPIDVISNGKQVKLNDVHNQAMTVGGTGDVLAGIIAGLISKGVNPYNAARMGIFLNGFAGNLAFKKRSYGLIATDIIEEIPNVLKKFCKEF